MNQSRLADRTCAPAAAGTPRPPCLLACLNAHISARMGDKSSEAGRRGRGATGIVGALISTPHCRAPPPPLVRWGID